MTNIDYDSLWMRPKGLSLTGKGKILAIIDQPLWQDHPAYSANIDRMIGESINGESFHGSAVMSIAVGELGIAADTQVVYCPIETWHGRELLLKNHAQALQHLRTYVEEGNLLDAISTSHGWMQNENGAVDNDELVLWFEQQNIPVFSANEWFIYMCGTQGASCSLLERFNPVPSCGYNQVAIPIDNRLLAHRNKEDIDASGGEFYFRLQKGGLSWAVPFVAGLFTLAREAQPTLSRHDFLQTLLATTKSIDFGNGCCLPVANIKNFCEEIVNNCSVEPIEENNYPFTCTRTGIRPKTLVNQLIS